MIKANPSKDGDAKLRVYRCDNTTTIAEPPNISTMFSYLYGGPITSCGLLFLFVL